MSEAVAKGATAADLAGLPADARTEIVNGELVKKAGPSFEHGDSQFVFGDILRPFRRPSGSGGPGGWWFGSEVEIELSNHEIYLPDVAGWRRSRVPERPSGRPVRVRPDWVCEILSPSTAARDLGHKLRTYHAAEVPHYWVVSTEHSTLTVYRHGADGYVVALTAGADEVVRAEPFDAIELQVGLLFGADPEDDEPPPS